MQRRPRDGTTDPAPTSPPSSDIVFSPAVKAIQTRMGSRSAYARLEARGGFRTVIDDDLAAFIGEQISFFLASASADGQPYIQHRGGPAGFLHVLSPTTLAFADLEGNRQYITLGNLSENPRVQLFLIDYATRSRVKIWGHARVVDDPAVLAQIAIPDQPAARAIVIEIDALDSNCHKHIPQRFEAADVARVLADKDRRIAELEAALAAR